MLVNLEIGINSIVPKLLQKVKTKKQVFKTVFLAKWPTLKKILDLDNKA